jgi:hypothetical protein
MADDAARGEHARESDCERPVAAPEIGPRRRPKCFHAAVDEYVTGVAELHRPSYRGPHVASTA